VVGSVRKTITKSMITLALEAVVEN